MSSGSPYEPAVGFSRAVRVGDRVLVSGTAPVWADGSCSPDPAAQARRCLEIVEAALREAGATIADVVRTRTYLVDRDDWETVDRVHGEVFGATRPASTMVVVAGLLDPRWRVEIEAEAVVPAESASAAQAVVPAEGAGAAERAAAADRIGSADRVVPADGVGPPRPAGTSGA